jgi:N-acetylglucosaminyldiphosphoundecaprenol N-acetyl-beta-D-mannosaminyltransferase
MALPARINIIGSLVSICDSLEALQRIAARLESREGGYVCFTNAHGAVMGRDDAGFRVITNDSFLSLADGKSVHWLGRLRGIAAMGHVPGPDFMLQTLQRFPERRHYFYGSTPEVLKALVEALCTSVPALTICGARSPPFRNMGAAEVADDIRAIRQSGAEFVWVGLGAPKQERWMAASWRELAPALLFGVGAAFEFHAGTVRRAPRLLRHAGLEWLYRLWQEPRRLWKRYLVTNCRFIYYSVRDALCSNRSEMAQ